VAAGEQASVSTFEELLELLRELIQIQRERGYLHEDQLRALSAARGVPLYHLEGLVSFYPAFRRTPPPGATVEICRDVICAMAGGSQRCQELMARWDDSDDVEIQEVSCLGRCDSAPAGAINHVPVAPANLVDAVQLAADLERPDTTPQQPLAPKPRRWKCDPYADPTMHYTTLRALSADPATIAATCLERLTDSGLCGMGGAGFSTARKWSAVADAAGPVKYLICNADESEPGTFKDRVILEELPHLVIEGMLLGALTVGAQHGIIYLRHEYQREQFALEQAIQTARRQGILGANAAGTGRAFEIEVFVSPGGYILGEETALLEALEDKRGEPRNKPPYPSTSGLHGCPTLINNVETLALATAIVHHGSEWWRDAGKDDFWGLKFVSISGDIQRPGVYEIPVGMTVAELIDLAGGMCDGSALKAFLPGGASSNFLPAAAVQTPLDFTAMRDAGSMLGTGAVMVFGAERDLFALATNLVRFFRNESCGKCVPCRLGSRYAVDLLEGVSQGDVPTDALSELTPLAETLQQTSICGLGQVALNPIESMLRHFPEAIPR
tara:strand:+ start:5293 stop:6960 length:1668 start_codon:yes stop_codon:yes gene_type:complete